MTDKKRFIGEKIQSLMAMFSAVAVLGPRQCGKSTLVRNLYPDWDYYDLERPDDYQLISNDPLAFFSRHPDKVIIDEAQQYPELFKVLRSVIDSKRKENGRFLLTGSSSPDIVKGLSESLAGRVATVELWPFKMAEFYEHPLPPIYELLNDKATRIEDFKSLVPSISQAELYSHWMFGGYPEPRIKTQEHPLFYKLWMDAYFTDFIHRDIQRLFPRLNTHNFRKMIQVLSFHSGNILNQSVIATSLELSSVTIKEYLDILHDTFIWRNLRSFEKNPLKKLQKMPKGHFRDSGILHQLLKLDDLDSLLLHPVAGTSFESFLIEEIIRGFQSTLQTNLDFNFYRTKDQSEIDLIIDGPFGYIPVEIKLGAKINKRMLTALNIFIADTNCKFGILVNNSEKIEIIDHKIIQIPAIYF